MAGLVGLTLCLLIFIYILEHDFSWDVKTLYSFFWSDCVCLSPVLSVLFFGSDADLKIFFSCFISLMFPVLNLTNECFIAS